MTDHESGTSLRVVVWMRDLSLPPDDPRGSVLTRLRELEAAGTVDDVSVRIWGKSITVSDDADETAEESNPPVRKRISDFRRWAERNGHSLEPAFRWNERSTMISEEQIGVIQLPLLCLAIYKDGRLVGVFPCSTENGTKTVADWLKRLETAQFG